MTSRLVEHNTTSAPDTESFISEGSGVPEYYEYLNKIEQYKEIVGKLAEAHDDNLIIDLLPMLTDTTIPIMGSVALTVSMGTRLPPISAGNLTGNPNLEYFTVFLDDEPSVYGLSTCYPWNVATASTMEIRSDMELDNIIRDLVEDKRINEAKDMLMLANPCGTGLSPRLAEWARLLAPPVMSSTGKGTAIDSKEAMKKLEQNKEKYSSEWVALKDDEIIDHDKNKVNLYKRLKERDMASGLLFIYVD